MAIKITVNIDRGLTAALGGLSQVRLDAVKRKQATEMLNRARAPGGTPFDTGELRASSGADGESMGYTKEYAGHVEYGHRTGSGTYRRTQRPRSPSTRPT